ncbi:MAG: response regulator [Verrucomicrobia bacterium]|nr:response regulator [Verrucomicrobiota bacterium]
MSSAELEAMKIKTKLHIIVLCSLGIIALASVTLITAFRQINAAWQENAVANDLTSGLFELGILTTDYVLHDGERAQAQWLMKHDTLTRLLNNAAFADAESQTILKQFRQNHQEIRNIFVGLARLQAGNGQSAANPAALAELKQRFVGQLDARTQTMVSDASELADLSRQRAASARNRSTIVMLASVGLIAVILISISWLFDHTVVLPIERLQKGTLIIGSGDLSHKVSTGSQDEVGQLARSFDEMTEKLKSVTVSRDDLAVEIAERKRAQEELRLAKDAAEEASRTKSHFLANMSHELRTPLNSVIGFANILLKNKSGSMHPEELTFLERIVANGKHLLDLINQVLDLSKIEAKRVEIETSMVTLERLITVIIGQFEPQLRDRPVKLAAELPDRIAPLETDAGKLKQVIINLVGNALKFTERGSVTVSITVEEGTHRPVRITIADTGIGIPEDRRAAIFEAFQQADPSTTRKYGGTGLGLTISKALCELMGYRLEVASEVGKGSTFNIVLARQPVSAGITIRPAPLTEVHGVSAAEAAVEVTRRIRAMEATQPLRNKLVLIIDDEADSRVLLTNLIEQFGCHVIVADGGELGLRMAKEIRPDLITLDLLMPHMDGWEVLRQLKADADLKDIPVIVVSVVARERRGTVLGAIEMLQKPVSREDLLRVISLIPRSRILVVEDNEDDRRLFAAHLEGRVSELRMATNGREALAMLESFTPNLILLDLMMPEMDGMAFLDTIRKNPRHWHIPVFVVTAKELTADEAKRLGSEAQAVLKKAEEWGDDLERMLNGMLKNRPSRAHLRALNDPSQPAGPSIL